MLKITLHDSAKELRFRLEGKLSGLWVKELRQCWQTARSTTQQRETVLDLSELDFVDSEGQELLAEMDREGVVLRAASPFMRAIVEEICAGRHCATVEEQRRHVVASPSTARSGSGAV